jgi:hypothetical protein
MSHFSDEYGEKCVNVLLEGEEAELVFIDHPSAEISVNFFLTIYIFSNFLLFRPTQPGLA